MREEKKGKQTSERRKYRENEQKGRPLAAPQSFEMPVRSAAETASISPSAAAAEKENDPDTAVVAAVAASASTAVMSVSAAAAQEQDDPQAVVVSAESVAAATAAAQKQDDPQAVIPAKSTSTVSTSRSGVTTAATVCST